MAEYVPAALFVHTAQSAHLLSLLQQHSSGADISTATFDQLSADPDGVLAGVGHVVVSGSLDVIKAVVKLVMARGVSIGLVPTEYQKNLVRYYDLPGTIEAAVDLALQSDAPAMDVLLCNRKVVLFKATVGRMPMLDAPVDAGRLSILATAVKRFSKLKLLRFQFSTAGKRQVTTAASGCMVLHHPEGSTASRLVSGDVSVSDGFVSTLISAPISVMAYLKVLLRLLGRGSGGKALPDAIGCLKSPSIDIEPETELAVSIDGRQETRTPLHCEAVPAAVRINVGPALRETLRVAGTGKEKANVDHLPRGKEVLKARKKGAIPFFSYASEERFRDLFTALREDADVNSLYLVLMVLSTMLATAGLYLDSASVIIGAMLLAPLMAPIVSLAMGLLRADEGMIKNSVLKIAVGIGIALAASSVIALLFPFKPVTGEMRARLNPTLLDMAVAIISGVAAAYSKSFKEIIQSLAGVAIAVALVPPLAVAGTGIGRGEIHFFSQAFLLFSTNLVGIIIAAIITFRVLGFSPVIRSKRGLGLVMAVLVLIAIPLYMSFDRMVEDRTIEKTWQTERFLVNGKYIIIEKADLHRYGDKQIVLMEVVVRDMLTRDDMNAFKEKIQTYFPGKLIIRAKTTYIP